MYLLSRLLVACFSSSCGLFHSTIGTFSSKSLVSAVSISSPWFNQISCFLPGKSIDAFYQGIFYSWDSSRCLSIYKPPDKSSIFTVHCCADPRVWFMSQIIQCSKQKLYWSTWASIPYSFCFEHWIIWLKVPPRVFTERDEYVFCLKNHISMSIKAIPPLFALFDSL